jgi:hypothetical protein
MINTIINIYNFKSGLRKRNHPLKKCFAVSVIILFISVAIIPSINADISKLDNKVELTTELYGLNKGKQKVMLTEEESAEVEDLFESIRDQLNEAESIEESKEIMKEAVVELDKYNLLGGLTIEQAQELVTYRIQELPTLNRDYIKAHSKMNFLCLIAGHTEITAFSGPFENLLFKIYDIFYNLNLIIIGILYTFFLFFMFGIYNYYPLPLGYTVGLGFYDLGSSFRAPAKGWITSIGLNGLKTWIGEFYGQYPSKSFNAIATFQYYPGIIGFSGLRINLLFSSFYLGSALIANIGTDHP